MNSTRLLADDLLSVEDKKKLEQALAVYDRRKHLGEPLGRAAIAEEIGSSEWIARMAIRQRQIEEAAGQAEIVLSSSAQKKYDAKVEAFAKKWRIEFEAAVAEESQRRLHASSIPYFFKQMDELKRMLQASKGLMPRKDFIKILSCLHEDQNTSPEKRHDAFITFKSYETTLVKDRETPHARAFAGLPQTVEELLKRKTKK